MNGEPRTVLVVDDDPMNFDLIGQVIEPLGVETATASNGIEALSILEHPFGPRGFPGIVLTDVRMPELDGLGLLARIRAADPELPVILLTSYGDVPSAVQAMKDGAYDFIERPFDREILLSRVRRALASRKLVLENRALRAELQGKSEIASRIIGTSEEMERLRRLIIDIASTDATVLLQGETGTGKELVARCVHDFGENRSGHFVALNCGALPEGVLESELFGHEPGAFTGATALQIRVAG